MAAVAATAGTSNAGGDIVAVSTTAANNNTNIISTTNEEGDDNNNSRSVFTVYCTHEMGVLDRKVTGYTALSKADQEVLSEYGTRLQNLALRVNSNGKFLQVLMKHGGDFLPRITRRDITINTTSSINEEVYEDEEAYALEIRGLFSAVARDWSLAGAEYRAAIYAPILSAVAAMHDEYVIADPAHTRDKLRICVPSAGTGRLCWELAQAGYSVEGNEASYLKLATSNYLLNHADALQPLSIYPYIHDFCHVKSARSQLAAVAVPDVQPNINNNISFSMRVGTFLDVYHDYTSTSTRVPFDAVVTALAFDLDEASYDIIRTVNNALRPGGLWIFLGPAPMPRDDSSLAILLSHPEFVSLVKKSGFKIIKDHPVTIPLSISKDSLRNRRMNARFFTAMKVRAMK